MVCGVVPNDGRNKSRDRVVYSRLKSQPYVVNSINWSDDNLDNQEEETILAHSCLAYHDSLNIPVIVLSSVTFRCETAHSWGSAPCSYSSIQSINIQQVPEKVYPACLHLSFTIQE